MLMPLLELLDEITECQTQIAPLVERFQKSLAGHTSAGPLAYHAARTHAALNSLERLVDKYRQDRYQSTRTGGLDDKDFLQAEHVIDMIRHAGFKNRQSNATFGKHHTDFATPTYEKSQNWLLEKSFGTTHADAILWHFAYRDYTRRITPNFEHDGKVGASRQLWPPTKRTMEETRGWLNPGWSLSMTPWKQDLEFDDDKMSVSDLAAENRQRAIESLRTSEDLSPWDKELVGAAIERSMSGGESTISQAQRSISQVIRSLPSLQTIQRFAMDLRSTPHVDPETFILTGDSDDERDDEEDDLAVPSLDVSDGHHDPARCDCDMQHPDGRASRAEGYVWHEMQSF
jgi:hypothetical protein